MSFSTEVRLALRRVIKGRLLSVAAVATLALAIGANTALFSVVDSVLLQPLPYPDSHGVVAVWGSHPKIGLETASLPDFVDWKKRNQVFENLAAFTGWAPTLTGRESPRRLLGSRVSGDFFSVLRTKPELGRTVSARDDSPEAPKVAVVSHAFWRQTLSSRSDAIGEKLVLNGSPHEIIGVLPENFRHPAAGSERIDVWAALALSESRFSRRGDFLRVVGRLKSGETIRGAQANMDVVTSALSAEYPDTNTDWSAKVISLREEVVGSFQAALWMLFGAVTLVLLVACGNIANLLLAGAADRVREFAVRSALGAARWDLVRLYLLEGLLIGLAGGLAGLPLAVGGIRLLKAFAPENLPRLDTIAVDVSGLAFTVVISLAAGAVFGLLAGRRAIQGRLEQSLREGGRRATETSGAKRFREALVVGQIALALTLVFGAGLLLKSLSNLDAVDPGFDSNRLVTFSLALSPSQYGEPHQVAAFHDRLLGALGRLTPVESVGGVSDLPLSEGGNFLAFVIDGRPPVPDSEVQDAQVVSISPGYLETMRIAVLTGRPFDSRDHAGASKAVLISRSAAERYWPDGEPLGSRLSFGDNSPDPWWTVVGVVEDVRTESVAREAYPQIYRPQAQAPTRYLHVALRTDADVEAMAPDIRRLLRELDPETPVEQLSTMNQVRVASLSAPRFRSFLLGIFSFLALTIAAVGLYGVLAHSVKRRFQEIGIRLALGATGSRITLLVLGHGIKLSAIGVAAGFLLSKVFNRALSGFLFGVGEGDPATFLTVAAVLFAVAILAAVGPALRASRIDPLEAIRCE